MHQSSKGQWASSCTWRSAFVGNLGIDCGRAPSPPSANFLLSNSRLASSAPAPRRLFDHKNGVHTTHGHENRIPRTLQFFEAIRPISHEFHGFHDPGCVISRFHVFTFSRCTKFVEFTKSTKFTFFTFSRFHVFAFSCFHVFHVFMVFTFSRFHVFTCPGCTNLIFSYFHLSPPSRISRFQGRVCIWKKRSFLT